jgi:chemotaxis protein methyltransferase CheR
MVAWTKQGIYNQEQMRGLSESRQDRWFKRNANGKFTADSALRSMLICKRLNLFENWPFKSGVDVVMCRNVLIYFNPSYQNKLLSRFAEIQKKGSYLFLGHSETLDGFSDVYRRIENTVYERL